MKKRKQQLLRNLSEAINDILWLLILLNRIIE